MPKPRQGFMPPEFSGQSKIMFITEGNSAAMLVENKAGKRKVTGRKFPTAEAAFAWCRRNLITLVYFPVNPAAN